MKHETRNMKHGTQNIRPNKIADMFRAKRGFTLVEMIVAIAVFAQVMVVATGSLLTVVDANKKAESLQTSMNNLNFALDTMTRNMRTGRNYHCGSGGTLTTPQDCPSSPASSLAYLAKDGATVMYCFQITDVANNTGEIRRAINPTSSNCSDSAQFVAITAPELKIDRLDFYVAGTAAGPGQGGTDRKQPKILAIVGGGAQTGTKGATRFDLETLVSQRIFDN